MIAPLISVFHRLREKLMRKPLDAISFALMLSTLMMAKEEIKISCLVLDHSASSRVPPVAQVVDTKSSV
jgi:hypothetical protein